VKGFICFPPLAPQVERRTGVASQRIGIGSTQQQFY